MFIIKRLIFVSFILLFVLMGCSHEPAVGEITPTATQIRLPTSTPTELIVATLLPIETAVPATPTPFPTPTTTATPTPIVYIIQEGETLLGIAIAQGTTTEEILALNPDLRPEALQIGQAIVLPPQATAVSNPQPLAVDSANPISVEVTQVQSYDTPVGGFWVVGEVVNLGEQAVENVQVEVRFLDDQNEVVDTVVIWVANPIIQVGDNAPFAILLPQRPAFAQIDTAVIAGNTVVDLGERYTGLQVIESSVDTSNPAANINGKIQNVGTETAVAMQLIISLYDSQNRLVGYVIRPLEGELLAGDERDFVETAVSLSDPIDSVAISFFAHKMTENDE